MVASGGFWSTTAHLLCSLQCSRMESHHKFKARTMFGSLPEKAPREQALEGLRQAIISSRQATINSRCKHKKEILPWDISVAVMTAPPSLMGLPNSLNAVRSTEQCSPATAEVSADSFKRLAARQGAPGLASSTRGLPSTASWSMWA